MVHTDKFCINFINNRIASNDIFNRLEIINWHILINMNNNQYTIFNNNLNNISNYNQIINNKDHCYFRIYYDKKQFEFSIKKIQVLYKLFSILPLHIKSNNSLLYIIIYL